MVKLSVTFASLFGHNMKRSKHGFFHQLVM